MYLEEVVGGVVDAIKDSLKHNVMVFFDTRFARQWRPSLLKEGGPGARGGEASPAPRHLKPLVPGCMRLGAWWIGRLVASAVPSCTPLLL